MAVSTRPEGGAGTSFFTSSLRDTDAAVHAAITGEVERLQTTIELIASENIVSRAVLEAQGSVLTNKYAEGYPGRRYYGGCENVDIAEGLAIERAIALFGCGFANVQPHSGAQANQAAFLATLEPGDAFLGLSLASGGHLTHGAPPNLSGKWFKAIQYGVRREDALIDFDEVAALAEAEKPKLILAGGSAYPRIIDFARFRKIADAVGAVFMVDMAHFAGLVAAGIHPNPFPHAHIVTTTTHKTLRGPRGGMILTDDEALAKRINSAVFPGLQGGPLEHVIAAKAVALGEAMTPAFKDYARQVVANAKALAGALVERGYDIVSGGTDTHLLLVDLRAKGLTGKLAEAVLERAGITCNKNGVPFDPQKPWITSGIRLGSPAATSRGFGTAEFRRIAGWIADLLDHEAGAPGSGETLAAEIREDVRTLCAAFPVYPGLRLERRLAVRCPFCGNDDTQVKDSRPTEDNTATRRRRQCPTCKGRFTTFERIQLRELSVIKNDGQRVPFERDKMLRSMQIALRKRPVAPERIDQIVTAIVRRLESLGETEIPSSVIGEMVMETLSGLDQVGYVRFASVYRNFGEKKDFEEFIGGLADAQD